MSRLRSTESTANVCCRITSRHLCHKISRTHVQHRMTRRRAGSACATAKRIDGKDRMVTMKIHRSHATICSCSSLKLSGTTSPATINFSGWAKMRCRETQRERSTYRCIIKCMYIYIIIYIYIYCYYYYYYLRESGGQKILEIFLDHGVMSPCRRVAVSPCRALGGMWHAAMHHSEEQHHKTPRDHDTTLKNRNQGDRS